MPTNTLPNVGNDLIRIHKVVTRALEVSRKNSQDAASLAESDQPGFTLYVRALTILLHGHHASEDELAFPFWRKRLPEGPFDQLSAQHRQMVGFLEKIEGWLEAGPASWQVDLRSELQSTLAGLQTLWLSHIRVEEASMGPENSSKYLTPEENGQLSQQMAEHSQAHSQPGELVMPFCIYNLSGEDRAEFVRLLPAVITQQLVPLAWKAAWAPMLPFLLAE